MRAARSAGELHPGRSATCAVPARREDRTHRARAAAQPPRMIVLDRTAVGLRQGRRPPAARSVSPPDRTPWPNVRFKPQQRWEAIQEFVHVRARALRPGLTRVALGNDYSDLAHAAPRRRSPATSSPRTPDISSTRAACRRSDAILAAAGAERRRDRDSTPRRYTVSLSFLNADRPTRAQRAWRYRPSPCRSH